MKNNTITIFAFGIVILYNLVQLKEINEVKQELSDCNNDFKTLDSLHVWKSERLKLYIPICLEQNKLIRDKPQRLKELEYKLTEGIK